MEPMRRDPKIVENDEQTVLNARAPRSLAQMAASRGLHRRIEDRDFSGGAQPPGKLDVLHQRNFRETSQL
jgi:hypothetical protein